VTIKVIVSRKRSAMSEARLTAFSTNSRQHHMSPRVSTCCVSSFVSGRIKTALLALISFLQCHIIMINQLVVNQKVLDDGDCCAYANPPSSLPCTNDDMVGFLRRVFSASLIILKMFPSNSRISRACPNHGFAAPYPIIILNPKLVVYFTLYRVRE
jgi:hypothetical protein